MSNPNTDGEASPAGPNRDAAGLEGTGQASVGREGTGREGTEHEGTGRESTLHASIESEGTEHEGAARGSTLPDATGHNNDGRGDTGSWPGDLPEIAAPGLSAFAAQAVPSPPSNPSTPSPPSAAANAAAGGESPAMGAVSEPDRKPDPKATPFRPVGWAPARRDAAEPIAGGGGGAWTTGGAGAAFVRALPSQHIELAPHSPLPEPPLPPPAPSFGLRRIFAMTAVAAVIGGLAGSLTTAGFTAMTGSPSAGPSYDQVFADGLARIDREVAVLKGAIDTSTRTQTQQVAKIADRMDRAEKAQNDAGTRLAKAGDVLDRVERRLATSGEVTGGLGEVRGSGPSSASAAAAAAEAKRPVVEGWTLRDVYHGAAMIQGHGEVLAVLPGDSLPGLGRIEAVKRQDGRWVVVTARGLILPR
jgi:hypothetical protein